MDIDSLARVDALERRVARLDDEVALLRERVAGTAAPIKPVATARWAPPQAPIAQPDPWSKPHEAVTQDAPPRLVLDSEAILKWGGVGLVVLAVGFAVSTAISRNWIGPGLQLAGALLVALGLIGAGLRVRSSRPAWTHAMCSGGVLALFTTVASNLFLDQIDENIAFVATAAIGAGAVVLARMIDSEWVAAAAVTGGVIGWAVIGDGDPPFIVTAIWFVVVAAAVVAVSVEREWFAARIASHVTAMIALLALSGEADGTGHQVLLAIATALVVASLFGVPSIGDLTSTWQQLEVQLAAAAAPWAFGVTFVSTLEPYRDAVIGWSAIAIAVASTALAFELRTRLRDVHFVSLLIGASVTLSIGLAVLLSTTHVFVALAVQGAGLVLLSKTFGQSIRILVNAAVVTAISAMFVFTTMVEAWTDDASIGDDIGHVVVIAALAFACWQTGHRAARVLGAVVTLGLALIWLGSVLVHLPQGQAAVSVSWAVVGTAVFVVGAARRYQEVAAVGLAVLGLTVGKLLTVDLREVDALWRAGLFFVVGIGLMRLGFMLPRLARTEAAEPPAEVPTLSDAP